MERLKACRLFKDWRKISMGYSNSLDENNVQRQGNKLKKKTLKQTTVYKIEDVYFGGKKIPEQTQQPNITKHI